MNNAIKSPRLYQRSMLCFCGLRGSCIFSNLYDSLMLKCRSVRTFESEGYAKENGKERQYSLIVTLIHNRFRSFGDLKRLKLSELIRLIQGVRIIRVICASRVILAISQKLRWCQKAFGRRISYLRKGLVALSGVGLSLGLSLCLGLSLGLSPNPACAGLNQELDRVFDELSNSTSPNSYMTERRGVVAGGSLKKRNYVFDLKPVSVTTPSVKAGCGGIDLYGGSFSYINKDEFVSFLRSVAANAKGYAFSIALSSMCEKCFQHMETLQRKVMELNTYFGNSCQLAQGLVNDSLSAFDRKGLNDASLIGQFKGMGDLFELSSELDSAEVYRKAKSGDASAAEEITGNVMWQNLLSSTLFIHDTELAEAVMSITGTVITNSSGELSVSAPGGLIGLRDLIEGGQARIYRCVGSGRSECLTISVQETELKGLAFKLEEAILGPSFDGKAGIVGKLSSNNGSFSEYEKALINSLPPGMFARIRTLAATSLGSAVSFTEASSRILALGTMRALIMQYIEASESSLKLSHHPHTKTATEYIAHARESISREALELAVSYGSDKDLIELYELLMRASGVRTYIKDEES